MSAKPSTPPAAYESISRIHPLEIDAWRLERSIARKIRRAQHGQWLYWLTHSDQLRTEFPTDPADRRHPVIKFRVWYTRVGTLADPADNRGCQFNIQWVAPHSPAVEQTQVVSDRLQQIYLMRKITVLLASFGPMQAGDDLSTARVEVWLSNGKWRACFVNGYKSTRQELELLGVPIRGVPVPKVQEAASRGADSASVDH